jgi:hypothetical protein
MNLPEYVTKEEVRRMCKELGLSDWTQLTEARVSLDEAKIIQSGIGNEALAISAEAFKDGLEVELEHGVRFPEANVTNNHPLLTGKIVLAHLKESLDYYVRLEVSELEGDLLKAYQSGDAAKLASKYALLLAARAELAEGERVGITKRD